MLMFCNRVSEVDRVLEIADVVQSHMIHTYLLAAYINADIPICYAILYDAYFLTSFIHSDSLYTC